MRTAEDWSGMTGIVTGAGSGIGAATASLLVELGATVVGIDLNAEGLAATAERMPDSSQFRQLVGDVCDDDLQTSALELAAVGRRVDFLVNNAAVFLLAGVAATREQWTRTIDVNLIAGAQFVGRAVPYLKRSPRAAVVNIASISAHRAQRDRWTYNAAKGAVLEVTRCQALDIAPIRVNSVSPGWIWTEVLEEASGGDRATWEGIWGGYSVLQRCGEPSEIADAVAFLLSERATFITGVDLPVDGGFLAITVEAEGVLDIGKQR